MDDYLYHYKAVVVEAYDGDTITVDLDLGFGIWKRGEKLRLARINAPEVRGAERPQGLISRDYVRERIVGREVTVRTYKDAQGKYGRYLADVMTAGDDGEEVCLNDELVTRGLAAYADY